MLNVNWLLGKIVFGTLTTVDGVWGARQFTAHRSDQITYPRVHVGGGCALRYNVAFSQKSKNKYKQTKYLVRFSIKTRSRIQMYKYGADGGCRARQLDKQMCLSTTRR